MESILKSQPVLEIEDLSVEYKSRQGIIKPVDNVSLQIRKGEFVGLVGESGCGKSTLALSIVNLLPPNGKIIKGKILLNGNNLLAFSEEEMARQVRGKKITMITQNPHTALNPVFKIGSQMEEILRLHKNNEEVSGKQRRLSYSQGCAKILEEMRIADISRVLRAYPHQLSGGMKQRVITAMAFFCNPLLLIADEPTTALDVTIQAQILELFKGLVKKYSTSILYVTHDLGVVSELSRKALVMYAGEIVEESKTSNLVENPKHPYTEALLKCLPSVSKNRLKAIPGRVPDLTSSLEECKFFPRCSYTMRRCKKERPPMLEIEPGHRVRCFKCC